MQSRIVISRRKHNKKKKILVLVLLSCIILLCVYFLQIKIFNKDYSNIFHNFSDVVDTSEKSPSKVPIKVITHYFVPVTYFKNLKTSYTLEELKQSELITITENANIFPEGFEAEAFNEENIEAELEKGKIAILTPEQVKPNYKTIVVDGLNIWDKDLDKTTYPLFYEEKRPGETGLDDNLFQEELSVIFTAGEIIPARAVDRLSLNKNNNYTYLFDGVREFMKKADLRIAQLENPLLGDPTPCQGCVVFVSDEKVAPGLAEVGFDFLAFSGNHAGDAGQAGYKRTSELLEENKIQFTGMGKGIEEQLKPAITEVNGQRIGMISADEVAYFYWSSDPNVYAINSFSIASNGFLSINQDRISRIRSIKEENKIDYLIIYESWGIEYTNRANEHQRNLARAFIDNGADLVVASHPHWVQNIEFYKDKPIIYALGNFIFDQTHTLETRQAVVANLYYYRNELKNIELIPLQVCGYHQTSNDLTNRYLSGELTLEQVWNTPENEGCVYWQPRKLEEGSKEYNQILERIFEY